MSTVYRIPTIWESNPLVAVDILGYVISLRKLTEISKSSQLKIKPIPHVFVITKGFSIVQLCAVLVKLPPAFQLKQLNTHAHSIAAVRAACRRDFKTRPWNSGATDHQYL